MSIPIDFMLTAKCNLKCPFCYGPDPTMTGELSLEAKKYLIAELAKRDVSHVIFAGGEPLLSDHAVEIIPYTKSLGVRVGLQTNAFYRDRLREVLQYLDWLALPLDGIRAQTQLQLRTSTHQLDRTKAAVQLLRSSGLATKLKIGTVITPQNIQELPEIAKQVHAFKPSIWKWYQVRPRGEGRTNFQTLKVSRGDIERAYIAIKLQYPDLEMFASFIEQSINAYLIVNPDSEALVPQVETYVSAGHLIKKEASTPSFDDAVWNSFLAQRDAVAQAANVKSSFPSWWEE